MRVCMFGQEQVMTIVSTGEDGMEGDHKTDEEGKLKSDEDHDVDDHQQVLQAQGHVSEAHASEGHPAHEHMDAHIEQQGEPPQIDADGHIEAHGEVIGEGQVEAPCEGPGDGSSEVEGQDDGHHDGPGAGPDDYRVLASHAEAQQGEGEEAVRHDVENEGGEAGQEAPDYADGPEVGQNEVEAPGDHSSANHMDPGADESTEHKVCPLSVFALHAPFVCSLTCVFGFPLASLVCACPDIRILSAWRVYSMGSKTKEGSQPRERATRRLQKLKKSKQELTRRRMPRQIMRMMTWNLPPPLWRQAATRAVTRKRTVLMKAWGRLIRRQGQKTVMA